MEDLEIIEESNAAEAYKNFFTVRVLAQRKPVWLAMSEIWLHEDITDYDLNYIAIRLFDSGYSGADLENIFHQEVVPVLQDGQYIMNNQYYLVEANWLEDSILKHLHKEQEKRKNAGFSRKVLQKFGYGQKKSIIKEQEDKVLRNWRMIQALILEMGSVAPSIIAPALSLQPQ